MKRSFKSNAVAYALLIAVVILWVLPVLWMVLAALDGNANIFIKVPDRFTLENFRTVISDTSNQQAMINSLVLSLGVALCVMVTSTLAGYVLSRCQSHISQGYMLTILFMTTLPGTVLIVPVCTDHGGGLLLPARAVGRQPHYRLFHRRHDHYQRRQALRQSQSDHCGAAGAAASAVLQDDAVYAAVRGEAP